MRCLGGIVQQSHSPRHTCTKKTDAVEKVVNAPACDGVFDGVGVGVSTGVVEAVGDGVGVYTGL